MARARRRGSSTLSLFAFQDIVTSVTAIMILIVLMMALEFVSRSRTAGIAEDHRAVAAELQATIRQLEGQLAGIRRAVRDASRLADVVVGVDAGELARRHAEESARQRTSEAAVGDARAKAAAAAAEREAVQSSRRTSQLAGERSGLEAEAERSLALSDALERENRERATRIVDAEGTQPGVVVAAMVFNPPPAGSKQPALVEVAASGVAVAARPGAPSRPLGWGLLGPPSALGNWLRGLDADRQSVLIVLRPSGVKRYDSVRAAVLRAGFDVGTELVGEATRIRAAGAVEP